MSRSKLALAMLLGLCSVIARAQAPSALSVSDYLEIEQLVNKYGWALDSGENNGFAYADLYSADGIFIGTNQGPKGRSYQGRENLAALARGGQRGPLNVSHLVANLVVTPTPAGAIGRVYAAIFDRGAPGARPGAGHGGFYDDVYVKTPKGWRFARRTYYEGKWGEPDVPPPSPVPAIHALHEAPASPPSRGARLGDADHIAIQQLVAGLPYEIDMNADDGAAYANGFTTDGTFACVLPDTGTIAASGLPSVCVPHSGRFTTRVRERVKGRAALASAITTEQPHGPNYVRHFIFNHVIERTRRGATGKAYVAVIDITPRQPVGFAHSIFTIGRYDDEYVKTKDGWRIRSRVFTAVGGGVPKP